MVIQAKLLVNILLALNYVDGARILGVFPLPWGSHYILGTKLLRGLAEAGHDVTMIGPFKYKDVPKNGSWTDVLLEGYEEQFKFASSTELFNNNRKTLQEELLGYASWLLNVSNMTLRHPNVQDLIKSNLTFDAVIIEQLMNDCHHVLAYIFKCPLIILSSIGPNHFINDKVGCPSPISTVESFSFQSENQDEMTLSDRFYNLAYALYIKYLNNFLVFPKNQQICREIFPSIPDLNDIYYNVSLVLLNSHTSIVKSVPLVPNMVEIGGYFIDPPQQLPQDLLEFLDEAIDGAIYFSMGSHLKSTIMPSRKKKMFIEVFKKLKQRILWKYEDNLPEKSENVLIRNWMPQQDILAHPNIKLFITHGGLLSSTEAIYHGVPMLVIPVFSDQNMNAGQVVQGGYGLKLPFNAPTFVEETLNSMINELLYNTTYREAAKMRSKIYHDRPLTPMQSAVYWVEYVIKHKGANHLRVQGTNLPWYKYLMIDVFASLLMVVVVSVITAAYIFRTLTNYLRRKTGAIYTKLKNT